jgi:hypothetical protein
LRRFLKKVSEVREVFGELISGAIPEGSILAVQPTSETSVTS